jgi:hypothetical protein
MGRLPDFSETEGADAVSAATVIGISPVRKKQAKTSTKADALMSIRFNIAPGAFNFRQ